MLNIKNKKGSEAINWVAILLIVVFVAVLILMLYLDWKNKSVEGAGFIKNIIKF